MQPHRDNHQRDLETLELLIESHADGLRQLLEDHGGIVRNYLQRKFHDILDHADLDEVMGSAAVRVWKSAPRFDSSQGRLRAWFAVIARNCALRLLASRSRLPEVPIESVDSWTLGKETGNEAERMGFLLDVHRSIRQLPQLPRDVLLADIDNGSVVAAPVLAERLQVTVAAIWNARTIGRRLLGQMMAHLGHEQQLSFFLSRNRMPSTERGA